MTWGVARGEREKPLPPPFNPDPRLIRSRAGGKRATRRLRRDAERQGREALEAYVAEQERRGVVAPREKLEAYLAALERGEPAELPD